MELTITVTTVDETYQVTTTPWVIMAWERKYKTKVSKVATDGLGLEDLAYLAWEASKTSGRTVPMSFDAFAQSIKGLELGGDDNATPTLAAPSVD